MNTSEKNNIPSCGEELFSLSVVMPVFNEAATVRNVIDRVCAVDVVTELIIVDDGSTDGTGAIADKLAERFESVRVVHHEVNRGYGGALQSGFKAAVKEFVFYTDGDGQFDITELSEIITLSGEYDIVSCYRMNRQEGFVRKLNAWAWTRLVGFLLHLKLRDVDCAFKLFRREIFDNITMKSTGALIDSEILARAKRKGYSIGQCPVHHYPRTAGASSGAGVAVIWGAFKELFRLRNDILSADKK